MKYKEIEEKEQWKSSSKFATYLDRRNRNREIEAERHVQRKEKRQYRMSFMLCNDGEPSLG